MRDMSPSFRRPRQEQKKRRVSKDAPSILNDIPIGKGKLYTTTGEVKIVDGPFDDLDHLYNLVECESIQMVPCTIGNLNNNAVLIMDEEGMFNKNVNNNAVEHFGEQVCGGTVYGNILVLHIEDFK
jgi:hypothetical protein